MNAIIERLNSAGGLFVNFSAVMLVQASILILILLALDFLLRRKVRAVFRYCVWLLVLVKLIIPPSISSPLSIGGLFGDKLSEIKIGRMEPPGQVEQAGQIVKAPRLAITEPKPELYKQIDPAGTHLRSLEWQKEQAKIIEASTVGVEQQQKPVAVPVSISWQGTVFLAWAVALLILILLLIQRAMFVRGLVAQADEITGGLKDLVQSCGKLLGMKGKVRLKTSPNATSPAVCGLFRPVILLPQNLAPSLTKEQLKAVLLHELIHIKRGDLWINLAQALLQITYFYNPLVWLANAIIRRAREQAVDEAVQVAIGKSAESYPQILVDVAKLAFKRPALSLRLIGVVENKSALKNRIARMLSRPIPKKAKLGLVGLISVFIVAAVLLPMAKAQKESATDETGVQKPQFKAELNNDVTIELVGVCGHPSKGEQWWRPDGNVLSQAPYHTTEDRSTSEKEGYVYYEFALKLNQPDVSYYWMIPGSGHGSDTGSPRDKEGHQIGSLKAYATNLPRDQKSATVRIGATAAEWQTVATHKPQDNEETVTVDEFAIAFGIPYEQEKRTLLPVVHNYNRRERKFAIRLVAITKSGQVRISGVSGSGGGQLNSMTYIFNGLTLDEIKEFQFQVRPYEWVEFKNVSVKPNFKTNVQIEIPNSTVKVPLIDKIINESDYDKLAPYFLYRAFGEMGQILEKDINDKSQASIETALEAEKILNELVKKTKGTQTEQYTLTMQQAFRHFIKNLRTEKFDEAKVYLRAVESTYTEAEADFRKLHEQSSEKENITPAGQTTTNTNVQIGAENPVIQTQAADAGKNSESEQANLQRLIDSARAGQTVTVPKGTFTEPIVINKSLRLKGEDVNDCIIEVTADEPAVFVDTKGKGMVTIENLTIKWQLATSDKNIELPFAAAVKDSRAQIKNCNFVPLGNYQRCPVALRAQGFTNMAVSDCRFEGYNYTVQYGDGTEGVVQACVVANSGHQGVSLYSGANVRITGNIITGSKYHGIRSTGGKLLVRDNLITKNENSGIYLGNKSASGAITNNIIIGNGTNISAFANSQVSITNNIIADSAYAGVSMRDSCRLAIANNIFQNNTRGLILHKEAGKNTNRISKNTFWKNEVNLENIEQFAPPIEAEPGLVDPNGGDFSLKSGPVLEQNQGLKKPEVFKALWEKFKKLETVDSVFEK